MGNTKYHLSSPDADSSSARLLYVTFSRYEEDWTSLRHSHHFCELFYVKNGKGEFVIEDDTIPIQKDDLILVNPNVAHTEISFHTEPLEYLILGVDGVVFSFSQQSQYMILHCKNDTQTLLFYFSTLLKEITEKKPDYELACQKLLEVLLIQLSRYNNFSYNLVPTQTLHHECSKVKHYIDAHYAQDLSLDALAKGIRSYDENKDKADTYEIMTQYNELEAKLAEALYNEFGVTETQIRDIINNSKNQEEYTAKLQAIIDSWQQKNREDER
mgnify:CR=1 FL=1